jgi:hypothetical protein
MNCVEQSFTSAIADLLAENANDPTLNYSNVTDWEEWTTCIEAGLTEFHCASIKIENGVNKGKEGVWCYTVNITEREKFCEDYGFDNDRNIFRIAHHIRKKILLIDEEVL